MSTLVLLGCLVANAAATCESWCSKWTCGNTNSCGGCTSSICAGAKPHSMCSDVTQPSCDSPRCDLWCSSAPALNCGRVECQCDFCGAETSAHSHSRSAPAPTADDSCSADYLRRVKAELQLMVDGQTAKNAALKNALAPGTVPPTPPAAPTPPPPPCSALHTQCGGFNHKGSTSCCGGMRCHYYNNFYSGCLPASNQV